MREVLGKEKHPLSRLPSPDDLIDGWTALLYTFLYTVPANGVLFCVQ